MSPEQQVETRSMHSENQTFRSVCLILGHHLPPRIRADARLDGGQLR